MQEKKKGIKHSKHSVASKIPISGKRSVAPTTRILIGCRPSRLMSSAAQKSLSVSDSAAKCSSLPASRFFTPCLILSYTGAAMLRE